ncbi:MAG: class I SAM-dependent methyltransferase [Bacteroidia bacterium]|nr:class I SAM-dependent methyltransferase [Bacteroidia bacterium]
MITDDVLGMQLPPKIVKESHAYGDVHIASTYCGFKQDRLSINGEWQHGAIIPERNIHPEFVIGSDGRSFSRRTVSAYYVAREDQKKYLESCGYKYVHAIGMPIIYLEKPKIERIKNSLLIMPIHSLSDTIENFSGDSYANYIDSISPYFSEIALCVHSSCFTKGHWMQPFIDRGITIIEGADERDINSLNRMAHLFCRFEFVATNGFGSHLAYAAFFGAKVSINGPIEKFDRNIYTKNLFYSNVPELLDILEKWDKEEFIKKAYPFLFIEPQNAKCLNDWAEFQLGLECKKSPRQLKRLFGWSFMVRLKGMIKKGTRIILSRILNKILIVIKNLYMKLMFNNELLIFTHLTFNEKYTLYRHSKQLPKNSICAEIGSYLGSSSCFITKGLSKAGKLICIDTWGNQNMKYDEKDTDTEERDTYSEFIVNTKKYRNKIIEIRKWSTEAVEDVKKLTNKINFLFIDGDHNYEGVKKDWDLYCPLLQKGSIIAFHDTGWAEGVQKVISEDVLQVAELIKRLPNLEIYRMRNTS